MLPEVPAGQIRHPKRNFSSITTFTISPASISALMRATHSCIPLPSIVATSMGPISMAVLIVALSSAMPCNTGLRANGRGEDEDNQYHTYCLKGQSNHVPSLFTMFCFLPTVFLMRTQVMLTLMTRLMMGLKTRLTIRLSPSFTLEKKILYRATTGNHIGSVDYVPGAVSSRALCSAL